VVRFDLLGILFYNELGHPYGWCSLSVIASVENAELGHPIGNWRGHVSYAQLKCVQTSMGRVGEKMSTNDQVILREVLDQRRKEIEYPLSKSDFFELFVAEQVLKDFDLSWEEIESGIVGGGGDGGIDGFYFFINGELIREDTDITAFRGDVSIELHIIQAKQAPGFEEVAIQKLRDTVEELLDLSMELPESYNTQLLGAVDRFRQAFRYYAGKLPQLSIAFHYATLGGEPHPNVERRVCSLQDTVRRLFSSAEFSFDFLGARELLRLTRKQPRTTYELRLSDSPISTENNAYVCLVELRDYYDFIVNEDSELVRTLFDANVRDYQGNVQVNKGIRDTLEDPKGEDFWWLNNGITILATGAVLSGKTLTLVNPRVVNGLQTSLEIASYFKTKELYRRDPKEDRKVLVRVIVPEAKNSFERIIRATNSQTSIPIASLSVMTPKNWTSTIVHVQ